MTSSQKPQGVVREFLGFVDLIVKWLCIAMMIFMVVSVLLQVITRYALTTPVAWTEEMARFLLIWIAFLASSHIARTSSYIRVTFFTERYSPKVQRVINIVCKLLMLGFTGFFVIQSFSVYTTVAANEVAPVMQIPMIIPRSALFIGQGLAFCQMLAAGGLVLLSPEEEVEEAYD